MQSKAKTVSEYLKSLPADRRAALEAVRRVILENLDPSYEEGMQYGMIGYYVPHSVYPPGYHCDPAQPLPFAGLASQKNYMSLYVMGLYADPVAAESFSRAWKGTGRKLDMGKCCVRFRKLEDVPLEVVGEMIRACPASKMIAAYEAGLASTKSGALKRKAGVKKKAAASKKKVAGRVGKKVAKRAPKKVAKKGTGKKAGKKRG